jgi:hypothetical protein
MEGNMIIIKNFVSIPYSYLTLHLKMDREEDLDYRIDDSNFDLEGYNFIINGDTEFHCM